MMTPEEAENFHEDDEDPQRIAARFDAVRQIRWGLDYIRQQYAGRPMPPYSQGGDLPGSQP